MTQLFYPLNKTSKEMEIKKSKFISFLFPYSDEGQIKEKLKELRIEHKNAAHVVYAFIAGKKNSQVKGMSDDGEPSGTAGKPVLSILEGHNYTNILVVVVRYYGGIKLGTGGLVKAYSDIANLAIKETEFRELVNEKNINLIFSYEHQGSILSQIKAHGARVEEEEYSDKVRIEIAIKEDEVKRFTKDLNDITSGCIDIFLKE